MITAYNLQNQKLSVNENKELARGGEGRIILLKGNQVAKIFHHALSLDLQSHFQFLMNLPGQNFLAPIDILFKDNQIIGFVMPLLSDDYVPLSALFGQAFCQQHAIAEKEKAHVIEQIYNAIAYAHQQNMVIGDLNPYNVMIHLKDFSVKMIDVDSYQTPYRNHNGLLLEDIRDYQYAGAVNKQSDFFAFSVLVFSLLTYTHPFKGIHQQFKSLKDRMQHAVPVYHSEVKKPKCYIPQNHQLQSVFDDFFLHKKRYLLNFAQLLSPVSVAAKAAVLDSADLLVQLLFTAVIRDFGLNNRWAYFKTDDSRKIFEAVEKSKMLLRKSYPINEFDLVFVAENTVVAVKDQAWFYDIQTEKKALKNIQISSAQKMFNYDGILLAVEQGAMFRIFLNEIKFDQVRMERVEVFSEGMRLMKSFVQNSGGVQNIFYNNGNSLTTVKLDFHVLDIHQSGKYLSYTRKENGTIKHYFAHLDGFTLKTPASDIESADIFAVQKGAKSQDILFLPNDDLIELRNGSDFSLLTQFAFKGVSSNSALFSTQAGIVIIENNQVFLVNKK